MKISVELTLTPIQDDYEPIIIDFIKALRNSGLRVIENPLSTQVYGEYENVMQILQEEVQTAFEAMDRGLLHMKLIKTDRSKYEPHF
ncbi:hypothetical protein G3567_10985 [Psychroflexus sp. YR1-1]|uniref:Thiamine-binding protein domain-containing protein n=1 Tax=Psychroflexus aurantiacus TaxID=2709310 RepID=A0A6B3R6B6_9FLAO|nr:thiamine-binding protein [Psychroflexus aurantiacus]NEV94667.1 hypothetical protein [Psychroflexus aurantiacus]